MIRSKLITAQIVFEIETVCLNSLNGQIFQHCLPSDISFFYVSKVTRSFSALIALHPSDFPAPLYTVLTPLKGLTLCTAVAVRCVQLSTGSERERERSLEKCIWQTRNSRQFVQLPVQMCVSYCVAYCLHPFVTKVSERFFSGKQVLH